MGQIVSAAAKPKRCNLNKLSQLGTPAAGEHILVSSDNSMNAAGQGNFDCYIEGNGQDLATALELMSIANDTLDYNNLNAINSKAFYVDIEIELSQYPTERKYVNNTGKWAVNYSTYSGKIIPISADKRYKITAGNNGSAVSFLKSLTGYDTNGSTVDFATGYSKNVEIAAGESIEVSAPYDAAYLFVSIYTNADKAPQYLGLLGVKERYILSSSLAQGVGTSEEKVVSQAAVFTKNVELEFFEGLYINTGVSIGSVVDLSPHQTQGTTSYCIYTCKNVSEFVINAIGGNASRAWAFIDEDNKLISCSDARVTLVDYHLAIPENANKIIINDDGNGQSYAKMYGDVVLEPFITNELGDDEKFLVSQYGIKKAIKNATTISKVIDINKQEKVGYNISNNGIWVKATAAEEGLHGVIIKVSPNSILHVEANNTQNSYFSILRTAEPQMNVQADFASGETGRHVLNSSKIVEVTLPFDAHYLFVYCQGVNSTIFAPSNITIYSYLVDMFSEDDRSSGNGGMETPTDVTVLNVGRKGHQFSDVEYTTQGTIIGAGGASISAGNKVGIPYTSCMEVDKFVGFDVTLKTFMTCVNNPYSLLYTENLYSGTSGYGFTYNGAGSSTNIGGYMGVVCNVFALHAIGMKTRFDSGSDAYLAKIGIFDKIYNQSAQGLQIGDVWWEQGHNRVITNLWRSERGLITKIEMSESVHNFPQVVTYTPSAFDTLMASKHAIIYRCNELYKNINYEVSPFVAVEDEVIDSEYTYNDDICTFAGDYASFREGQIIYLNYNLKTIGAWTSIELTKGNTVIGTYSIDSSSHRYDLTSLNLTHGLYKARMSDGNGNYSDYTYFEIIDTNVMYSDEDGNNKRITFSSTQGTAVYLDVCSLGGRPKAKYEFTDKELSDGYATVNIEELVAEQYNNIVSGETYIKVSFQGEYGRACCEYILTDL